MKTAIKKSISIVLAMSVILSLTSCRALRLSINVESEQKQLAEKILRCFDDRDSETLKSLLCERTKALPDLDEQIQAAFDFYEGKMVSYNDKRRISNFDGPSYQVREKGRLVRVRAAGYIRSIITDSDNEYTVFFANYLISEPKDKEGISQIIITAGNVFGDNRGEQRFIGELIQ